MRDDVCCDSEFPFRDAAVYKPLLEAIIEAGVTELEDVVHLKPGQVRRARIPADGMAKIARLGLMLFSCMRIGGGPQRRGPYQATVRPARPCTHVSLKRWPRVGTAGADCVWGRVGRGAPKHTVRLGRGLPRLRPAHST
jgi:hypothetical protein